MNIGIVDQAAWTDMDGDAKKGTCSLRGMDAGKYFFIPERTVLETRNDVHQHTLRERLAD